MRGTVVSLCTTGFTAYANVHECKVPS